MESCVSRSSGRVRSMGRKWGEGGSGEEMGVEKGAGGKGASGMLAGAVRAAHVGPNEAGSEFGRYAESN